MTHALLVLKNERRIIEDARRELLVMPPGEDRAAYLASSWRELTELNEAIRELSAKRMGQGG